ncbi:hypothetical protein [Planctomicrobium sp. SH527]|uniref:hypothetical protein n=1 Tax=Planctomicrobium sp. SH527 TaxID=3448123 RepID=UPI003F5C779A
MQNLFLKVGVLLAVISGSCVVVWKAHEGLQSAATNLDVDSFVKVTSPEADTKPQTVKLKSDKNESSHYAFQKVPAKATASGASSEELEPTLAAAPPSQPASRDLFSGNSIEPQPEEPTPTLAAMKQPAEAEPAALPQFFADDSLAQNEKTPSNPLMVSNSRAMPQSEEPAALPQASPDVSAMPVQPEEQAEGQDSKASEFANTLSLLNRESSSAEMTKSSTMTETKEIVSESSKEIVSTEATKEDVKAAPASEAPVAAMPAADPFGLPSGMSAPTQAPERELPSLPNPEPLAASDSMPAAVPVAAEMKDQSEEQLPLASLSANETKEPAALPVMPIIAEPLPAKAMDVPADFPKGEMEPVPTLAVKELPQADLPTNNKLPLAFPEKPELLPSNSSAAPVQRETSPAELEPTLALPKPAMPTPEILPVAGVESKQNELSNAGGMTATEEPRPFLATEPASALRRRSAAPLNMPATTESPVSPLTRSEVIPEPKAMELPSFEKQSEVLPTLSNSGLPSSAAPNSVLPEPTPLTPTPLATLPSQPVTPVKASSGTDPFGLQASPIPAEMPPLPPASLASSPEMPAIPSAAPKTEEVLPELPSSNPQPAMTPPAAPASVLPELNKQPSTPALPSALPTPSALPQVPPSMGVKEPESKPLPSLGGLELGLPAATPSPAANPTPLGNPTPAPMSNPAPLNNPAPAALPVQPQAPNSLLGSALPEKNPGMGLQSPELKIEKVAPPEAVIGEPVVYAIVIRNVGGSPARDVIVEDRIPKGTQLEGTIPQAYLNDGKLSWQLDTIAPGEERKIQLKVTPLESGQIGSVATVSFAASVSASINVTAPKLSIEMVSPNEAALGEHLTIQFKLRNIGQGPAKNVYLRTILPAGLKHPGGNDLEYEAGTLNSGAEKIIELNVTPEMAGTFTPVAQISIDNKTHDEARADIHVIKGRLELTRTGPDNRFVGRPAQMVTRITNNSGKKLNNIIIQEKVPVNVELATLPRSGRWDSNTRLITWNLPELLPGESREMNSSFIAHTSGDHNGTLAAQDDSGNRVEIATSLKTRGFAELAVDVSANQRTVIVGERVSFKLTLKNEGSEPARSVKPRFVLPAGFEFANAYGPTEYTVQGRTIEFKALPEIGVSGEQTFEIAAIANAPGSTKLSMELESADYTEPLVRDQPIRVIAN